jgi:DNA helicase II / ATP-dependent DNA helicase PcrA
MRDNAKAEPLNDAQKAAVAHTKGPMMVVAGAGTGKTRVITERIVRLIESGTDPGSILALTFTENAAGEMLDRINQRRGGYTLDATIATYNGFGEQLLQEFASEIGLGNLKLLGETGQLVFIREHLDEFALDYFAPIARPDSQLELLASYVSSLKQQLIQPAEYNKYVKSMPRSLEEDKLEHQKHSELAAFYETYITLCRANQVIDYDDQLFLTIELLRKRPNIRAILKKRYAFILVDEFQDTNPMQSELLDMLLNDDQDIMVVGDDDQSIYGWRGATLANILQFKEQYPRTKEVTLIENYRTTQNILDSAYKLIQGNNPDRLEAMHNLNKRLIAHSGAGEAPHIKHFSSLDSELNWVAEQVALRLKKGQDPASIAVLARTTRIVEKMHAYLELSDIPHAVAGLSQDLYKQPAVGNLLESLKAISDPLDSLALYHCLSGPLFNMPTSILSELASAATREHRMLSEVINESENAGLKAALERIEHWRERSSSLSVGALAYAVINESGWKDQLYSSAEHDPVAYTQAQANSQFFKTLKEFERISDVASLQSYLRNLQTLKAAGSELRDASLDISETLVNVLSVHRAKGLEWETVFIIDCTEGSFPIKNHGSSLSVPEALKKQSSADNRMSEERRLMYVGMTRAKRELIISYSDTHTGTTRRRPSRFIAELQGHDKEGPLEDNNDQTVLEFSVPSNAAEVKLPVNMQADGKLILTASQIDCWLRCPQDFYYSYVLQMPIAPDPSRAYGTLIHNIIQTIHEGLRKEKLVSLDMLLERAKADLPKAGYLTVRSRERAHAQALKTIRALHKRFSEESLPIEVEKPFRVEVPDTDLVMTGRIDAVYPSGKGVEIRDYKTGTSVTTPEKAKRRATASNQLTLYALAWRLLNDEMPDLLTLDFVETGLKGSVRKQEKSLVTFSLKLRDMTGKIRAGDYPMGKDHEFCKHPL